MTSHRSMRDQVLKVTVQSYRCFSQRHLWLCFNFANYHYDLSCDAKNNKSMIKETLRIWSHFFFYLQHAPLHSVMEHALWYIYSIYIFGGFVYCLCTVYALIVRFHFFVVNGVCKIGKLSDICSLTRFSSPASCLLLRYTLLVFLFPCLVCCIGTVDDPLFGFR